MQIMIDIPDELYDSIQNKLNFNGDLEQKDVKRLLLAIYDSIKLPKGHGDLIDVNGLKASMSCYMSDSTNSYTAKYVMSVAKGLVDFQKPIVKADNEEE